MIIRINGGIEIDGQIIPLKVRYTTDCKCKDAVIESVVYEIAAIMHSQLKDIAVEPVESTIAEEGEVVAKRESIGDKEPDKKKKNCGC